MAKFIFSQFLVPFLFVAGVSAQTLSAEEQRRLTDENKMLREEIQRMKAQPTQPANSGKMMEALIKGQKFQEEQNKALEELDKED